MPKRNFIKTAREQQSEEINQTSHILNENHLILVSLAVVVVFVGWLGMTKKTFANLNANFAAS